MASSSIVFSKYYDGERGGDLWLTWSEVNKRTFFCVEPDCSNEAYLSLGHRCGDCFNALLLAEAEAAKVAAAAAEAAAAEEHHCSGEFDYDLGSYVCDDHDDPRCPSYKPHSSMTRKGILIEISNIERMLGWDQTDKQREHLQQSLTRLRDQLSASDPLCPDCGGPFNVALLSAPDVCGSCAIKRLHPCLGQQKLCADCGATRKELEPVLNCDWYCPPCWQTRFGLKPADPSAADQAVAAAAAAGALLVNRWRKHTTSLTQCRHCQSRNTDLRHEPMSDVFYLDCKACASTHSVDKALLDALPFNVERSCADCGHVPEDGFFPCYRGDDAICVNCDLYADEAPDDWRERTGRCSKCDLFYALRCSSDRRDRCYSCHRPSASLAGHNSPVASAAFGSHSSVSHEECPGCGNYCRGGLTANGYCVVCRDYE